MYSIYRNHKKTIWYFSTKKEAQSFLRLLLPNQIDCFAVVEKRLPHLPVINSVSYELRYADGQSEFVNFRIRKEA